MNRLSYERLDVLLARAREVTILVAGDLMLDVYLRGAASRISPEAPVPVVKVEEEWRALGGAANVAHNVVALGAGCKVVGCIGLDRSSVELRGALERAGIAADGLITDAGRPTTVKTRIMARHQQVARYDHEEEGDIAQTTALAIGQAIRDRIDEVDVVVLEDYNKGVLVPAVIRAALDAAAQAGKPVVVDPKARSFFDYAGATIFKPNLFELSAALRAEVDPNDAESLDRTRRELGCENLLLTLGEEGMALMTATGEHVRVPTVARSVYDVSGAGDTVTAVVAVALAAGASPVEAAVLANHAAGLEVAKAGVATISAAELREFVREHVVGADLLGITPL